MAMADADIILSTAVQQFKQLTAKPEYFLSALEHNSNAFRASSKFVYDDIKELERRSNPSPSDALPTLIVENFDEEQIWQQLELQNDTTVERLLAAVASISTGDVTFRGYSKVKDQTNKVSDSSLSKHKHHKTLKGTEGIKTRKVKSSEKNNRDVEISIGLTSRLRSRKIEKSDINESVSEGDDDNLDDEGEDSTQNDSSDESESEKDLAEIKSRLQAIEGSDDGGSDDDLDFDFGDLDASVRDNDDGGSGDDDAGASDESEDEDDQSKKSKKKEKVFKPSVVDDEFFKLSEMEVFLNEQDELEMKKERGDEEVEDDDVNVFSDLDSSNDEQTESKSARKLKYKDYFLGEDNKPKKKLADSNEDSRQKRGDKEGGEENVDQAGSEGDMSEESEGEEVGDILGGSGAVGKPKSSFEMRQDKLREKIAGMEDASLTQKPWQLSGEVSAFKRPENSLLAETVQFEHTTRLPPVITEETTENLETIIVQRIKDKSWDDVERKVKPENTASEYKKRITLDKEKSKQSLGEIYEQEFLQRQATEEKEKKDPDHEMIKKSLRDLFIKLDALSNCHFTPKPAAPELVIVSNQPSISMEEVAPVSVSDVHLLAPEEIHNKKKGEVLGDTEKSSTDRKRERRNKKTEKRTKIREKESRRKVVEKLNPGLGNKYSKERALRELERQSKGDKSVTLIKGDKRSSKKGMSSKTFFTKLQDEVTVQIGKRKTETTRKAAKSAKKFKL